VKIILWREEVNPDKPGHARRTPLSWASENKHEQLVKILLERGQVNPNMPNQWGQTPLWYPAGNGH